MRAIAHRGASAYAPENTRAAFDLAIAMQADAIETDVQLTADGALVLIHDERVDRTTNGTGNVAGLTLAELQTLDAGGWFAPEHAGQRILTLHEALDAYLARIPFALEIKAPAAAAPMMHAIPASDRIEVTSFDWDAVVLAAGYGKAARFGYLTRTFDADTIDRCLSAGLGQICPHAESVTADLVALAHRQNLDVRAWGVSTRDQIDRLLAAGADGTTCNWPDWITGVSRP